MIIGIVILFNSGSDRNPSFYYPSPYESPYYPIPSPSLPYDSPYDSYMSYMNALNDLVFRLKKHMMPDYKHEITITEKPSLLAKV